MSSEKLANLLDEIDKIDDSVKKGDLELFVPTESGDVDIKLLTQEIKVSNLSVISMDY